MLRNRTDFLLKKLILVHFITSVSNALVYLTGDTKIFREISI